MFSNEKERGQYVIGIGCRRCGSSMMHDVLNSHSEIYKPARGLHYFSEKFDEGSSWYYKHFDRISQNQIALEYSVSYSYPEYAEAAAERIYHLLPDAKLFVLLRDPVERAFSDYLRSMRFCEYDASTTFEQALEEYPVLLDRGCYNRLLSPYFERFSKESIKVLLLEDLKLDPCLFWNEFKKFLGLSEQFELKDLGIGIGRRTVRLASINQSLFRIKDSCEYLASKVGLSTIWDSVRRLGSVPYRRLISLNTSAVEMNQQTRNRLFEYYKNDIDDLGRMTGINLRKWMQKSSIERRVSPELIEVRSE